MMPRIFDFWGPLLVAVALATVAAIPLRPMEKALAILAVMAFGAILCSVWKIWWDETRDR